MKQGYKHKTLNATHDPLLTLWKCVTLPPGPPLEVLTAPPELNPLLTPVPIEPTGNPTAGIAGYGASGTIPGYPPTPPLVWVIVVPPSSPNRLDKVLTEELKTKKTQLYSCPIVEPKSTYCLPVD